MTFNAAKYSEFFVIDEGYYPEINESSIKDPKNKWQHTFPHGDIVALLKLVERAFSRAEKKSIWIEGSYGTGKSRIVWMMQNLLTCPESEFDAYFNEYDNLRDEIDLRDRLRVIRRGKVVTASRYATGDITSAQKLIFAVFESLSLALQEGGYKFDGAKTLRGKIANWLESDSANLEMFRAKIQKPEYRMSATLANRSAEEIVERLKNPNAEVSQLVEEILKLGDREGIRAFNIDMKDLIDWIVEVIAENDLRAIVLFWDEFSKFFMNNRNNLDEFQRLAELTNIAPFYLFIATHEFGSLAGEKDQAFKTVRDRFTHKNITMPANIALELIGHALKIKETAEKNWHGISAAMRERTFTPRQAVMKFFKLNDEKILTNILPIHPMAAVLLQSLAALFASNQRSIFNFIKNSDPNVKAFQDFIATKSPLDGDLLTIDYLWNFFYESGIDELGGNVGRMNFKQSIRAILDSYALNKDNLNPDEQVVLKTILLLQAIDQESRRGVDIFHPTEENLELAFSGVAEMENGRAVTIANNLVRKNVLFKIFGEVETFGVMAVGANLADIEEQKKILGETVRTADLLAAAKVLEQVILTVAQKFRCELIAVTADNFTQRINRITAEVATWRIKIIMCFARNDEEQHTIHALIGNAIRNARYHRLVFVDASSNLMSDKTFDRWLENSAHEKYWRVNNPETANEYKKNAEACLRKWGNSFEGGSFVFYPATKTADEGRKGISCQNANQISTELKDNVRRLYPYSFDDAAITDTLFQLTNGKKMVEAGIKQEEFSMLKLTQIRIVLGNLWNISGKYWENYPDEKISRLKVELDAYIKDELARNIRVSFDEIFAFLIERGFMPLNIYAFLTGFLLKEYAADSYLYSTGIDGNSGGAMTEQKLAEYVSDAIKQTSSPTKNYRPKYLEIMSENQRQFVKFAAQFFGIDEKISVEQCAQKIREWLKSLGWPLWCYVDAAEDKYKKFLSLLAGIANSQQSESISTLTEQAGQFLSDNVTTPRYMKKFLTESKGRELFESFLKNFEDGILFTLSKKIGVENLVTEFQRRMLSGDGSWLRDSETAVDDLKKLAVDYKIIVESRNFGVNERSFKACVLGWKEFCQFNLKIPCEVIGEYCPQLKNFFALLKEIFEHKELPQSQREFFLEQLTMNAEMINVVATNLVVILRGKYSQQVEGLNDAEMRKLSDLLPSDSFARSLGTYYQAVIDLSNKIKSEQLKTKLVELWRKLTDSDSPRDWSNKHRTPILALVPLTEQSTAKEIFDTIMRPSPDDKSVKRAIDYLKKPPEYFAVLKDDKQIENTFRQTILDLDHQVLFRNNKELRRELESQLTGDVYQWYPNPLLNGVIEKLSQRKYFSGKLFGNVVEGVEMMSADNLKKLLLKWVETDYTVALKILKEYPLWRF